ncbi:MAG: DoxX family membrane protein [Gemmatimonadaceae bacterium]
MIMREGSLLLLRVSIGTLMLVWGADKLVNVAHGLLVSEKFYLGLFSAPGLLKVFGVFQILLGLLVVLGLLRRYSYPVLLAITTATLLGVWRSVVDPHGWVIAGGNVLFYPSIIIFAGVLVLWSFRPEDRLSIDARRGQGTA